MSADPSLPVCPFCGQPMRVRDLRPLALARSLEPPPEAFRHTISCCSFTLTIADDAVWHATTRRLMEFHGGATG